MLIYPFTCNGPLPPTPSPVPPPPPPPPPSPAQLREAAHRVKEEYSLMMQLLLEITDSPGELGMIGAHEGANWPSQFGTHAIPLGIVPNQSYTGTPRIFLPALRTVVSKVEKLFVIQAAILSPSAPITVT